MINVNLTHRQRARVAVALYMALRLPESEADYTPEQRALAAWINCITTGSAAESLQAMAVAETLRFQIEEGEPDGEVRVNLDQTAKALAVEPAVAARGLGLLGFTKHGREWSSGKSPVQFEVQEEDLLDPL